MRTFSPMSWTMPTRGSDAVCSSECCLISYDRSLSSSSATLGFATATGARLARAPARRMLSNSSPLSISVIVQGRGRGDGRKYTDQNIRENLRTKKGLPYRSSRNDVLAIHVPRREGETAERRHTAHRTYTTSTRSIPSVPAPVASSSRDRYPCGGGVYQFQLHVPGTLLLGGARP